MTRRIVVPVAAPATAKAGPLSPPLRDHLRAGLLGWFRAGHRDLPWRATQDPYAIWISEIMLQQTRVETVREYYRRFLARFPDPLALASAPLDDVLALWSGLGYYSRARNLHAAAREIADRHGGRFPTGTGEVEALPGIGPYTAGAVRSIALRQRAALVDGNVIRVLSRLFCVDAAPDDNRGGRRYWQLAEELVPEAPAAEAPNDPGDFNQALMELGATVCVPQRPACLVCPLQEVCQARRAGEAERYPPKKRERTVPTVDVVTLVVRRGAEVLLLRRAPAGLWGGLWEPPTGDRGAAEEPAWEALFRLSEGLGLRLPGEALQAARPLPPFEHVLTHRRMRFQPFLIDVVDRLTDGGPALGYEAARWIDPGRPAAIGLPSWVSGLLGRLSSESHGRPLRRQEDRGTDA